MISLDVAYFLHALPPVSTLDYLQRIYAWRPLCNEEQPVYLFLCYQSTKFSESFVQTYEHFPNQCNLGENRFILAGNLEDIMNIKEYISQLDCKEIEKKFLVHLSPKISSKFRIRDQSWNMEMPRIMSILNVTPDSFYDGNQYFKNQDYAQIAEKMILMGADIIDIGGESSRPGSLPVDQEEEVRRIFPALQQIRKRFEIPISIDTTKPEVARMALEQGADMINDVSGLASGREMIHIVKKYRGSYCLMHCKESPLHMQKSPSYEDIVAEIYQFFQHSLSICNEEGLEQERILLDPGIGFGKTKEDNFDLLKHIGAFKGIGCSLMLGTSNKSFIGDHLKKNIEQRDAGTLSTLALGWQMGATFFRVHNVDMAKDALHLARAYTN